MKVANILKTAKSNWEYSEYISGNKGYVTIEQITKLYQSYELEEFIQQTTIARTACMVQIDKCLKSGNKFGKSKLYGKSKIFFNNNSTFTITQTIEVELKDEDVKNWDSVSEKIALGK